MRSIKKATWPSTLLACAMLVTPLVSAGGPGNHADVDIQATDSAAAVCQVLVLVNALIVLELEDTLGLVTYDVEAPLDVVLPLQATSAARAECSVVIDELAIDIPDADGLLARGTYLSGPPSASKAGGARPGLTWNVNVTGAGSEARVCQYVVIVASLIVGGGTLGLTPGHHPIVQRVSTGEGSGPGGSASCHADIRDIRVNGAKLSPPPAVIT